MAYTYSGHTHQKIKPLILIETTILCIAGYLGLYLSSINNPFDDFSSIQIHITNVLVFVVVTQLALLSVGLYELRLRESISGIIRRVLVSVGLAYFCHDAIILNLFDSLKINPFFIPYTAIISVIFISIFRYIIIDNEWFGFSRKDVLVIGSGERASIIERRMRRRADRRGINLVGFVPIAGDKPQCIINETLIELDVKQDLESFVIENDIQEIIIACDERRNALPLEALFNFKIRGVEITDILDFIERETGQVAVNLIYPSWVIYSNGFNTTNHLRDSLDYLFNAFLGFVIFCITWPLMLITAILIFLEDGRRTGASVFYKQERVGLDGRIFKIIKFRSMGPDAEKSGAQFAQKNDDRTTKVGKFIRKYRIDELPQLFNVFKGEMGFVGPRPERPQFVTQFIKEIPYYNQRHNVKPGLTGWAQLKYPYGSSSEDTIEKLKFDLYYIKHRSIMFDLLILLRTFEIILFGKGR
ncbi:TIGR03013 family PEP-CTERM/XrtA system glycosyltransferase [Catenovulum sp. 2E275]|uniref:TIGR03013 family XrtA/PEP-CTERM system glycosyltransferase n=1 Tax=Catenovulum sp. 2E275 TaxID=2980497 RepID=UPI0021CF7AC0|nr:TIGR03013 family XrtA/PEP-CTERM system glycosyltransferase [Catenovulum sp. 2E275]MCU4675534.1 TIGR03013 family PEP-CTERM/XrtA system glycosyltransferase [Catenovulum sp. 2E275]